MRKTAVVAAALIGVAITSSGSVMSASPTAREASSIAAGDHQGVTDWADAINAELIPGTHPALNTAANEGCPTISRDGRRLFFASNRAGGMGGLDIWVSYRRTAQDPWGEPVNVGAPVNTPADEFCPSPMADGHGFLYVSTKAGGCGGADMYITRQHPKGGWPVTVNLGCHVNSAAGEASPFIVQHAGGTELYFSSTKPGGFSPDDIGLPAGDSDLYVSVVRADGSLAPPTLVPGLNSIYNDARPNVRRDGLEIIFDSDRPGTLGGADLFASERGEVGEIWPEPVNLGSAVNSTANETRPSLSWNARTLYFGSTRSGSEGSSDIYVTTRERH